MSDKLGTPEYNEAIEQQGQGAMDRALAMPLVRVFFALLALAIAIAGFAIAMDVNTRLGDGGWKSAILPIASVLCILPLLFETASVALTGRARTPWFRSIMRAYDRRRR